MKRQLEVVGHSAQRMNELIDGLLHLSRMAHSKMEYQQIDLSAMTAANVAGCQALEPQRRVEVVIAENVFTCGDPVLLTVVKESLLNNSWKVTAKKPLAGSNLGT